MAFRNPVTSLDFSQLTGQLGTGQLADGAITAPKIGGGAVTAPALGQGAVTAPALGTGAVTAPALGTGAVTTPAIGPGAVTATALGTGAVTAPKVGTGAIGYQALAVGTGNLIPDPSFEGAYSTQLVAGFTTSIIDTIGNASAHSLRIDGTSATTTTRTIQLCTVPVSPGDKIYLAVDYETSSTWVGQFVKFYCQWFDSADAAISFSVVQDAPVPGATWKRISGLVTAPTNAVTARIKVENFQTTAGFVWFDNAEARTALVAGAVSAGLVTTGMLAAGSVTADRLDANALNGKTITGSVIQTAATGNRAVVTSTTRGSQTVGEMRFFTEVATDTNGSVTAYGPADGTLRALIGTAPAATGIVAPYWKLSYEDLGGSRYDVAADTTYVAKFRATGATTFASTVDVTGSATVGGTLAVTGKLTAGNRICGTAIIPTTVANTPASVAITFPSAIAGTSFFCQVTASTTAPGTAVTGVGYSGLSATGVTLWATRSTALGNTTVSYTVEGS